MGQKDSWTWLWASTCFCRKLQKTGSELQGRPGDLAVVIKGAFSGRSVLKTTNNITTTILIIIPITINKKTN